MSSESQSDPQAEAPRRGKTTIAPEVLVNIARLAALSVPGVARLSPAPNGVDRLLRRGQSEGVHVVVQDQTVVVDVYLVVRNEVNVRDTSRAVQTEISRAISEMVGMDILAVNVFIEDVEFTPPARAV